MALLVWNSPNVEAELDGWDNTDERDLENLADVLSENLKAISSAEEIAPLAVEKIVKFFLESEDKYYDIEQRVIFLKRVFSPFRYSDTRDLLPKMKKCLEYALPYMSADACAYFLGSTWVKHDSTYGYFGKIVPQDTKDMLLNKIIDSPASPKAIYSLLRVSQDTGETILSSEEEVQLFRSLIRYDTTEKFTRHVLERSSFDQKTSEFIVDFARHDTTAIAAAEQGNIIERPWKNVLVRKLAKRLLFSGSTDSIMSALLNHPITFSQENERSLVSQAIAKMESVRHVSEILLYAGREQAGKRTNRAKEILYELGSCHNGAEMIRKALNFATRERLHSGLVSEAIDTIISFGNAGTIESLLASPPVPLSPEEKSNAVYAILNAKPPSLNSLLQVMKTALEDFHSFPLWNNAYVSGFDIVPVDGISKEDWCVWCCKTLQCLGVVTNDGLVFMNPEMSPSHTAVSKIREMTEFVLEGSVRGEFDKQTCVRLSEMMPLITFASSAFPNASDGKVGSRRILKGMADSLSKRTERGEIDVSSKFEHPASILAGALAKFAYQKNHIREDVSWEDVHAAVEAWDVLKNMDPEGRYLSRTVESLLYSLPAEYAFHVFDHYSGTPAGCGAFIDEGNEGAASLYLYMFAQPPLSLMRDDETKRKKKDMLSPAIMSEIERIISYDGGRSSDPENLTEFALEMYSSPDFKSTPAITENLIRLINVLPKDAEIEQAPLDGVQNFLTSIMESVGNGYLNDMPDLSLPVWEKLVSVESFAEQRATFEEITGDCRGMGRA